jgi:hypothetical protein
MAKYIKLIHAGGMMEGGRVLKADTCEAMLTPQNVSIPLDFDFRIGFMWWLVDPDLAYAGRLCQHGGDTNLSHTQLEILLDHKLGVVVLTNTSSGSSIKNKVALKALQLAVEEKAGLRPPGFVPEFSPVTIWSQDRLDALAGIYIPTLPVGTDTSWGVFAGALAASRYDRITCSGSGLTWTMNAGSASPVTRSLVPRANGRFSAPDSQETEYGFETVSGRKVMVAYNKGFRSLAADRYDPLAIPTAWTARVGTYRIVNLDPNQVERTYPGFSEANYDVSIAFRDGLLLFDEIPLVPVSDVMAYRAGLSRNLGETVRVVNVSGTEYLEYCGCRFRKI